MKRPASAATTRLRRALPVPAEPPVNEIDNTFDLQDGAPAPREEVLPDGAVLCRAPAKLNLSLRVAGVRDDGFHELDSVVAKITFYDELTLRLRDDGGITLACEGLDCGSDADNLALRAARALRAAVPDREGADIRLVKRIPPGTGLGGGSSDAAAVLWTLNRLWGLNLPADRLSAAGAELGSDVPLFLGPPASRMRGRGELIEPVVLPPFRVLLCLPDLLCPTGPVYAAWDALQGAQGDLAGRPEHAAWEARLEAGRVSDPPSAWRGELVNDLLPAAEVVLPDLRGWSKRLAAATGLPVHMTGSGCGLFVLLDDAHGVRDALANMPPEMRSRCVLARANPW